MMKKHEKNLLIMKCVLVGLTLVVLCLPWLFTQQRFSLLNFTQTGQIGDTIGGILSPFIAILVGYLTFEAFRMQYVANELQRNDAKEQNLRDRCDRFDNRFYTMLEALRANSRNIQLHEKHEGKNAFKALVAELFMTYYVVKEAYLKYKPAMSNEAKAYIESLQDDGEEKMLTRMAYGLFFYGMLYHVDNEDEARIAEVLEEVKQRIRNNGTGDKTTEYEEYLAKEINGGVLPKFSHDLFYGHNDQLGHYFRHIYQMVKFIALAADDVVDEEAKNEYVRIFRAELSDYEQVLLFYNAVSDKGDSWNNSVGEKDDNECSKLGLISRFRLIKNIPGNILYRGMDPWTYYKGEEKWWKDKGKDFFEQRYILTAEDGFSIYL